MGWGGAPTGAGLVDGGVDQGPWLQERVGGGVGAGWQFQRRGRVGAWLAVPKRGKSRLGGESKGFGSGRVGVLFFESWRVGKGWLGGARARGGGVQGLRLRGGEGGANFAF